MRRLSFQCLVLTSMLVGCGVSPAAPDPNQVFIGEVQGILWGELRRDELTSIPIMIQRYRQFGLRIKSLSDARIHPELVGVTQDWANASLEMSNVLVALNQMPKDDEAVVQGAVRLAFGESPISVLDRAASRLTEKQRWESQLEMVNTRVSAAQADFFRIQSRFLPEVPKSTRGDSPSSGITEKSPPVASERTPARQPLDFSPGKIIRSMLGLVYSWFGWPGVAFALAGLLMLFIRCCASPLDTVRGEGVKSF